ncbi:hypothetical protein [Rhodoferax sp.]|uniref:hypothetical protein n=1 Tax=Rhodoferax sp. TaxID=50421 RepID=UPI002618F7BF|nr:hypothetical protein [Rhodoferax sp.]MDD5479680.1 hypothetical protein [Rhodoferax sp.]
MSSLIPNWGLLVAFLAAWGGCGFWLGGQHSDFSWQAKEAAKDRVAREVLLAAQARGDALSSGLLAQQTQINQLKQESYRAISHATTGRTCLDGNALRVLSNSPGITVLPTTSDGVAAEGDAISTDTDIALWAADAGAEFETCRARLNALIDWHNEGVANDD